MRRVNLPVSRYRLRLWCIGLFASLLTAVGWSSVLGGCDASPAEAAPSASALQPPQVRVLLFPNVSDVQLSATLPPTLEGEALGGAVRLNLPEVPVGVSLSAAGWRIGNQRFARGPLVFSPEEDGSLLINRRRYRGRLRLVPREGVSDRFDVVNELDIESYLKGVLPKELPAWFHRETYEAQAVVARTYALWELKTSNRGKGVFDLYDDTKSQVYGGMDGETALGTAAVEETFGQVVVHPTPAGLRIFKAYFHSTSGGVTLGVDAAFNEPPIEALSAQSLDELSKESKFYHWDPVVLTKDELTRRVNAWGKKRGHPVARIGKIDRLEIAATNAFGRPTRFELVDTKGNRYSLIPEEIRWAINTDPQGGPTVYSGWFTPINNQHNIVLSEGRGWGHGVGMCQFSADGMAKQGVDHVEIVTRSYPGTQVVRAY